MSVQFDIFILALIAMSALSIGILVFVNNWRSPVNQSFSLFLAGVTILSAGFISLKLQAPFSVFDPLVHYGGLIFLLGLFVFSQVFPGRTKFPILRWPLYVPFIFFLSVVPTGWLIETAWFDASGKIVPVNGPLFIPYVLFACIYFLLSFGYFIQTYKNAQGKQRIQLEYLFVGMVVFAFSMVFFNMILPSVGITSLYIIGPVSSIVVISLTAISIIRHNLMDIRVVVQRGFIYLILLGLVVALYVFGLQALSYFVHQVTNIAQIISAGSIMVLGIIFFGRVETFFEHVTDPLFFKDKYDYAEALHQLSKVLHTHVTQSAIINASTERLTSILKPQWVSFRFEHVNETNSSAVLSMPIVFEGRCLGVLEFGEKRSGDRYSSQDIRLIETFIYQAAVALEKGRLYEEVETYSTQLEALVAERTKEIKQLQEEQRQTMIDISHNLQTPLAVIKGELELLRESSVEPEKMEAVRNSLTRISGFIRQLLHLAKLEHGAYSVELEPCDFTAIIRRQIEYFEVMSEENGVTFKSIVSEGRHVIMGNKRLLEELVTNLVVNAIKYRRRSSDPYVVLGIGETEDSILVTVEDNGIGIPEKSLNHIFDRFYRTDEGAGAAGSGLGLAIVKKIADHHHAVIEVLSSVGQGTTFVLSFPKRNI
jgi:signal transduction histidine kinase